MCSNFMTDSNGLELVSREVFEDNDGVAFARSFYPVTSMISVGDAQ